MDDIGEVEEAGAEAGPAAAAGAELDVGFGANSTWEQSILALQQLGVNTLLLQANTSGNK